MRWAGHVAAIRNTVARHSGEAPSPAVSHHARLLLIDTLGCALAGRRAPEIRALESAAEGGELCLPGGKPLTARSMCQVLACSATWDEACEGHAYAHGRPGVPIIAALLPLALKRDATLGELIASLTLGYEVGARAGGWLRLVRGLHVDGNWPGIGVAAAVSAFHGAAPERVMQAINAAACQLPYSLYLPVTSGATIRNGYLAHSAALGADAATATLAGFSAPDEALAHYAEHFSKADAQPLPEARDDLLLDTYFKPFAAVRHVHYGALAAKSLRDEIGATQAISAIELSIYDEAITYCGNRDPRTPLAAQFSLSFGIAAMLRFGVLDAGCYDEPQFREAELRRLEKLVRITPDAALTASRKRGATLSVSAARRISRVVDDADGALVLDDAGVAGKFVRNAGITLPTAKAEAFCAALLSAAPMAKLKTLWAML